MNPIDEGILATRISKIRHAAVRLKALTQGSRDDFVKSEELRIPAERYLQIAIQAMLDIGAYRLAQKGAAKPEDYSAIFRQMGRSGLLPVEFAKRIEGLANLRNILVHEYMEIDPGRLYDDIRRGLDDFETFCRHTIGGG